MDTVMQNYFEQIVAKTAEILKFDSSLKPAEENYPFGKETADCLAFFLSLAEEVVLAYLMILLKKLNNLNKMGIEK